MKKKPVRHFTDSLVEAYRPNRPRKLIEDVVTNKVRKLNRLLQVIEDAAGSSALGDLIQTSDTVELDDLAALGIDGDLFENFADLLNSYSIYLKDDLTQDAYAWILDIMGTVTYDNGLPLCGKNYPPENPTKETNYFDHYDRDQDFASFFEAEDVLKFIQVPGAVEPIGVQIDVSKSDLQRYIRNNYGGSSYEHDFGKR